jgi:hypothetical protein
MGERSMSSYERLVDTEAELVALHGLVPSETDTSRRRPRPDRWRVLAGAAVVGVTVAGLVAVTAARGNNDATGQANPTATMSRADLTPDTVAPTAVTTGGQIAEPVATTGSNVTTSELARGTDHRLIADELDPANVPSSVATSAPRSTTPGSPSQSAPPGPAVTEPSPTSPMIIVPPVDASTTTTLPESTAPPTVPVQTSPPIECQPAPPASDAVEDLSPGNPTSRLRQDLIGRWQGEAVVPGGWLPIGEVTIEFRADGTYEAVRANGQVDNPALYYGTFCYCPTNTYAVVSINGDGSAEADIDISWQGCEYTTRGLLHRLELAGDTLTFEFFPVWIGMRGPIRYELHRVP